MDLHAYLAALIGGLCIGAAAILMMVTLGRIAGISGIAFNGARSPLENSWSVIFMIGLALGAGGFHLISGAPVPALDVPMPLLIAAGLIVGFGTRLGGGCTSGHGICGIGRLSVRSIVATCVFMMTAAITVFVRLHGGVS